MNADKKNNYQLGYQSSVILFLLRLFLYLSVFILILIHPGISVSFDRVGIIQWFIIVPAMGIIAFVPAARDTVFKKLIFAFTALILVSIIIGGFSPDAFIAFTAGLTSFVLTMLMFRKDQLPVHSRWAKITAFEPFFLALICLRLLALSRSGEEVAGESASLTQFILVWTFTVFFLHSALVYLALNLNSRVKAWKEGIAFFLSAAAVFVIALALLPPDFVKNMIVDNLVSERIPQRIQPSDAERGMPQRGNGRRTLPASEEGGESGELRGVSEHEWPGTSDGSGESRQYLVKIVVSENEPVYMGDSFRGQLDPEKGFLSSPQESVNQISSQRLFVTWYNSEREYDYNRIRNEIYSLSILRQKYFQWRPLSADPVILNENAGPLRYIHQTVSDIHVDDPLLLVNNPTRYFTEREKTALAPYLEITLENEDMVIFKNYLDYALKLWSENRAEITGNEGYLTYFFSKLGGRTGNEYMENIIAILTSFSDFQYNLSYNDDYSISALKKFLSVTKDGDCVEFSNTLALLGRLAGIPSRVVTGYLAAEGLQTQAHIDGLIVLRRGIPFLQQFPFQNLYMVTSAHAHSWTQFYIPDYGWIDFEATSFAIPPLGAGDISSWDVVIPILDENRTLSQVRKFPWQAAGRAALILLAAAVVLAYALRYGREFVLYLGSQKGNYRSRARCLYLLLLARLAADGSPIKPASKTAHEYSELFFTGRSSRGNKKTPVPEMNEAVSYFKNFADIYSEIRWKEFADPYEPENKFNLLRLEYKNILTAVKKKGIHRFFIRVINLRGLAYL